MAPSSLRITYVSKFPPTGSGIGLYASVFEGALARLGRVHRRGAPSDPRESQRFTSALRGMADAYQDTRMERTSHIHVELSGRSLYEFYYAVTAVRLGRSLTLTLHDLPSIVGPSLLFSGLDQPGLRRVGTQLSRTLGKRLEQYLLRNSASLMALTRQGADWLTKAGNSNAHYIGHVIDSPVHVDKEPIVFCPGYIGDHEPILALAEMMLNKFPEWSLYIGTMSQTTQDHIHANIHGNDGKVHQTGELSECELLDLFAKAAVVVRPRKPGSGANSLAASGPLAWAVSRGCHVITNDERAGATELAEYGLLVQTRSWLEAVECALNSRDSLTATVGISHKAQRAFGVETVAERVGRVISPHMSRTSRC